MKPEYLYKYRKYSPENIDELFKHYATLRNPCEFRKFDENDSKIIINKKLTSNEITFLSNNCKKEHKKLLLSWFDARSLTYFGKREMEKICDGVDDIICRYAIYCLASFGDSNYMWKEYAENSTGFCIEFKDYPFKAVKPVKYQKSIPEISIFSFLKMYFEIERDSLSLGKQIQDALCTKLDKFKSECEYRFILNGKISSDKNSKLQNYNPEAISSIIFGSNMRSKDKNHIIQNIPFPATFKQAINIDGLITIEDYIDEKHLNLNLNANHELQETLHLT